MESSRYKICKIIMLCMAVGILTAPLITQADIYRWTDENGKVHFSDKPVGDKVEKLDIKVKPASQESIQFENERKKNAENFLRARKEEREIIEKEENEKKRLKVERKKNCKNAKKEYQKLIGASGLYYKNKDGTRDFLEKDRREEAEAQAKAEIKRWCK